MPASTIRDQTPLFVGIDLGTSGCRACAIDVQGHVQAESRVRLPPPLGHGPAREQDPRLWWDAVMECLSALRLQIACADIAAIAVDGTSSTLLLADADGRPLGPALMYNDTQSRTEADAVAGAAPSDSPARGPGASLAKALRLLAKDTQGLARYALHQADWVANRLCDRFGISDENNALKLGYDPIRRCWPAWFEHLPMPTAVLPAVVQPGTPIGNVAPAIAAELGISTDTRIVAGTTDSTAAVLATGVSLAGEAVTSLGSTMVLKVVSPTPVFAAEYGVYSHRVGDLWLAGGASNSGGAVLRQFFTQEELERMTPQLDPEHETGLDYYPLPGQGERFPLNDPDAQPRLEPPVDDRLRFFQGLLEGMARIEREGYRLLERLGAPYPKFIRSVGGGAANPAWNRIRARMLGVPVLQSEHHEAAYGAALLARQGFRAAS